MYRLIRPFLFYLDAERAHDVALSLLHYIPKRMFASPQHHPVSAMGLEFSHPIGLAAGCDKNGEHLNALAKLGFSFIELGTVTPRPQLGHQKPRLFRLPKAHAIINRMGFNNNGVDALVTHVQRADYQGILGINIGKNKETSLEQAADDYLYCLRKVYLYASYVTINISSPNTPELRQLQQSHYFEHLLSELRDEQLHLADKYQRYVPLLVKLSPDETDESLKKMSEVMLSLGIDGIIATNTTCARDTVLGLPYAHESGGLSGVPLALSSTRCLRVLKSLIGDEMVLIGTGGIDSPEAADEKLRAGASLLQIYTGLIYKGPGLVKELADGISII
jgi:dihydroorotate dehydrogenase